MSDLNVGCSICAEAFTSDQNQGNCVTPCGHTFHQYCIERWLQTFAGPNGFCPMCRSEVDTDLLQKIYFHFRTENNNITKPDTAAPTSRDSKENKTTKAMENLKEMSFLMDKTMSDIMAIELNLLKLENRLLRASLLFTKQ